MNEDKKVITEEKLEGVSTLYGYSVDDYHEVPFSDNSGYRRSTITQIDEYSVTPFYVKTECMDLNHVVNDVTDCFWSLKDIELFWGLTTIDK